jgi:hypothetical protein
MEAVSDEHAEGFDQDTSQVEKPYSGKWNPTMLADCCWSLIREKPTDELKRQKKTKLPLGYRI